MLTVCNKLGHPMALAAHELDGLTLTVMNGPVSEMVRHEARGSASAACSARPLHAMPTCMCGARRVGHVPCVQIKLEKSAIRDSPGLYRLDFTIENACIALLELKL